MDVSKAQFLVSKASILVSEASKLSTGARIFRGFSPSLVTNVSSIRLRLTFMQR